MERNRREIYIEKGESGWNVLSARWLYYKLNRSAQLRGWCTKGIGVTTPRSIIRNDGAFLTIHGYLVFTGYKRTNTFVRTWHTYPKRSTYKRVFYTETPFPMGKVRGTWGRGVSVQKKLNDTRPCLLALLNDSLLRSMHSINFRSDGRRSGWTERVLWKNRVARSRVLLRDICEVKIFLKF